MEGKIHREYNFFLVKAVILTSTLKLKVPPTAQRKRITILVSLFVFVMMLLMITTVMMMLLLVQEK